MTASTVPELLRERARERPDRIGYSFLVDGDTPNIAIRETKKLAGELLTLDEMRRFYLQMESWSQIVYDRLAART